MELSLRTMCDAYGLCGQGEISSSPERRTIDLCDQFSGCSVIPIGVRDACETFSPRMDIIETKGSFVVTAEMAGMDEKDICVSVQDGVLTVSGEKKVAKRHKGADYHHIERTYGCFSREVCLPGTVQSEKMETTYKDGILTVTLPKTEKALKHSKHVHMGA